MPNMILKTAFLTCAMFSISACSDYDPVAKSDCSKVVSHAQKILGALAPSASELMSQCQSASDSERGCVMASNKKGQLAQCL